MDKKLLAARDVILAYMMKEELTVDEAREVLHMCRNEIDAGINRMKIKEVTSPQSSEDTLAEKTAVAKFSAKEEERSLRGEAELNQSRPAFGRGDE